MRHEAGDAEASSVLDQMRNGLSFYEYNVNVCSLVELRVLNVESDSKSMWCRTYALTGVTSLNDMLQLLERLCCHSFLSCLLQ